MTASGHLPPNAAVAGPVAVAAPHDLVHLRAEANSGHHWTVAVELFAAGKHSRFVRP
jgi:hypothetical protein